MTIKSLDTRQQCRDKLPVFYGSRDNYWHGVIETLINASDEISNNFNSGSIIVTLHNDNKTITISDTGRGIPINESTDDTPNYVLLFEKLFTGTNFDNNKSTTKKTTGTNGCGSTVLNYTSSFYHVISYRSGYKYELTYEDGGNRHGEPSRTKCAESKHGTTITFRLDKEVYSKVEFDEFTLNQICNRLAGINNKLTIHVIFNEKENVYCYKNLLEYAKANIIDNTFEFIEFNSKDYISNDNMEHNTLKCIFSIGSEAFQQTFLNNTFLKDNGTIYDGTIDGFKKVFTKYSKIKFSVNDIEMGINFICGVWSNNVEFEGQTKFATDKKLYKKITSEYIVENMEVYRLENEKSFNQMLEHFTTIHKYNKKNEEDLYTLKQKIGRNNKKNGLSVKVEGLCDCDMKHSSLEERILILDEGLSANSTITQSFDNRYMGCYGLRGRFINSLKSNINAVLNNEPAIGIIKALGCGIELPQEQKKNHKDVGLFNKDNLRYGKVAILCDADAFGKGIALSLITFFYTFFPTLCHEKRIYFVISPRFEIADKKNNVHYAYNESERDQIVVKMGNNFKSIGIKKGLGEFDKVEFWEYVLSPEARKHTFIQVDFSGDSNFIKEMFDITMGENIQGRKEFISKYITNVNIEEVL